MVFSLRYCGILLFSSIQDDHLSFVICIFTIIMLLNITLSVLFYINRCLHKQKIGKENIKDSHDLTFLSYMDQFWAAMLGSQKFCLVMKLVCS